MADKSGDWTGQWIAKILRSSDEVAAVEALTSQLVQVVRKKHPTIQVLAVAVARFDASMLRSLLADTQHASFVVNISKEAHITEDALALAKEMAVGIGGVGDLLGAIELADVSKYVSKELTFIERGLDQHNRVLGYERLDDRLYRINRRGLSDLTVVFLNEYELTADHIRTAWARYGTFRFAVITNPNGSATSSAQEVATSMKVQIYMWGGFLGALNRR